MKRRTFEKRVFEKKKGEKRPTQEKENKKLEKAKDLVKKWEKKINKENVLRIIVKKFPRIKEVVRYFLGIDSELKEDFQVEAIWKNANLFVHSLMENKRIIKGAFTKGEKNKIYLLTLEEDLVIHEYLHFLLSKTNYAQNETLIQYLTFQITEKPQINTNSTALPYNVAYLLSKIPKENAKAHIKEMLKKSNYFSFYGHTVGNHLIALELWETIKNKVELTREERRVLEENVRFSKNLT